MTWYELASAPHWSCPEVVCKGQNSGEKQLQYWEQGKGVHSSSMAPNLYRHQFFHFLGLPIFHFLAENCFPIALLPRISLFRPDPRYVRGPHSGQSKNGLDLSFLGSVTTGLGPGLSPSNTIQSKSRGNLIRHFNPK